MEVPLRELGLAVFACACSATLQKTFGLGARQRGLSLRQTDAMDGRNALHVQAVLAHDVTEAVGLRSTQKCVPNAPQRLLRFEIHEAVRFVVRDSSITRDQRDGPRKAAGRPDLRG